MPILTRIDSAGQAPSVGVESDLPPSVDAFVARVRSLTDDDRIAIANARGAVDEAFHERALRAGAEALASRAEDYVRARRVLARVHVPEALETSGVLASEERARWNEVARLVQLAIDDGLIAILGSHELHPNHLRELYRSLSAASDS